MEEEEATEKGEEKKSIFDVSIQEEDSSTTKRKNSKLSSSQSNLKNVRTVIEPRVVVEPHDPTVKRSFFTCSSFSIYTNYEMSIIFII